MEDGPASVTQLLRQWRSTEVLQDATVPARIALDVREIAQKLQIEATRIWTRLEKAKGRREIRSHAVADAVASIGAEGRVEAGAQRTMQRKNTLKPTSRRARLPKLRRLLRLARYLTPRSLRPNAFTADSKQNVKLSAPRLRSRKWDGFGGSALAFRQRGRGKKKTRAAATPTAQGLATTTFVRKMDPSVRGYTQSVPTVAVVEPLETARVVSSNTLPPQKRRRLCRQTGGGSTPINFATSLGNFLCKGILPTRTSLFAPMDRYVQRDTHGKVSGTKSGIIPATQVEELPRNPSLLDPMVAPQASVRAPWTWPSERPKGPSTGSLSRVFSDSTTESRESIVTRLRQSGPAASAPRHVWDDPSPALWGTLRHSSHDSKGGSSDDPTRVAPAEEATPTTGCDADEPLSYLRYRTWLERILPEESKPVPWWRDVEDELPGLQLLEKLEAVARPAKPTPEAALQLTINKHLTAENASLRQELEDLKIQLAKAAEAARPPLIAPEASLIPTPPKLEEPKATTTPTASLPKRTAEPEVEDIAPSPSNDIKEEQLEVAFQEKPKKSKGVPELTKQERKRANKALGGGDTSEVLVSRFNVALTRDKIQCLRPSTWLNDEVINFYFKLMQERSRKPGFLNVWFANSFFWPKLSGKDHRDYNFKEVRRWTIKAKVDIFKMDCVIFPMNVGESHWALGVIDFKAKGFRYFDSMFCNPHRNFVTFLRKYVEDEHKSKKSSPFPGIDSWDLIKHKDPVPQQRNGFDCGVFTCCFADYFSASKPLDFSQADMPTLRLRIASRLVQGDEDWDD
eukprot:TRINITY_DN9218_c0_g1_i1.p1 TRINITY_DN9218_c0_g1~~TRINITY_DN9218_c0_g1_i1.p1  ORF type:complete len:887 (+),score=139.97 TRINITY_DN9218_c0_g1_i1:268-2661(+)